jgi:hypothetical protein
VLIARASFPTGRGKLTVVALPDFTTELKLVLKILEKLKFRGVYLKGKPN